MRYGRDVGRVTGDEGEWNGAIDLGGVLRHEGRGRGEGAMWDEDEGRGTRDE